jgi:hypothetical protein
MSDSPPIIVNVDSVDETTRTQGQHWGAAFKPLTPSMRPRGGSLGVNCMPNVFDLIAQSGLAKGSAP